MLQKRLRISDWNIIPMDLFQYRSDAHPYGRRCAAEETVIENGRLPASIHEDRNPNVKGLLQWPKYTMRNGETMVLDDVCEVKNDPDREARKSLPAT